MVKVTCYRQTETWNSRQEAMDFYLEGMIACMGSSEGGRYARIYTQLAMGADTATDED